MADDQKENHQTIGDLLQSIQENHLTMQNVCNIIFGNVRNIRPSPDVEFFNAILAATNSYFLLMGHGSDSNIISNLRQFANYRIPPLVDGQTIESSERFPISWDVNHGRYIQQRPGASGDDAPDMERTDSNYDVLFDLLRAPNTILSADINNNDLSQQSSHRSASAARNIASPSHDILDLVSPSPQPADPPAPYVPRYAVMAVVDYKTVSPEIATKECSICVRTMCTLQDPTRGDTMPSFPPYMNAEWVRAAGLVISQDLIHLKVPNVDNICNHWFHYYCMRKYVLSRGWSSKCPNCRTSVQLTFHLDFERTELCKYNLSIDRYREGHPNTNIKSPGYALWRCTDVMRNNLYRVYKALLKLQVPDKWAAWIQQNPSLNDPNEPIHRISDSISFRIRSSDNVQIMNVDNTENKNNDDQNMNVDGDGDEEEEEDQEQNQQESAQQQEAAQQQDGAGFGDVESGAGYVINRPQIYLQIDRRTPTPISSDDDDNDNDENKDDQKSGPTSNTNVRRDNNLNTNNILNAPLYPGERLLCGHLPPGLHPRPLEEIDVIWQNEVLIEQYLAFMARENNIEHGRADPEYARFIQCMLPFSEAPYPLRNEVQNNPGAWKAYAVRHVLDMRTHPLFKRNTIQNVFDVYGRIISVESLIRNRDAVIRRLFQERRVDENGAHYVYGYRWIDYSASDPSAWIAVAGRDCAELEDWCKEGKPSWYIWNTRGRNKWGRYQYTQYGSTQRYVRRNTREYNNNRTSGSSQARRYESRRNQNRNRNYYRSRSPSHYRSHSPSNRSHSPSNTDRRRNYNYNDNERPRGHRHQSRDPNHNYHDDDDHHRYQRRQRDPNHNYLDEHDRDRSRYRNRNENRSHQLLDYDLNASNDNNNDNDTH